MLLNFDKPVKIRSTEEHNNLNSSDSGVAGTYVPNMSQEDNERWKCKHIKGENERIEIMRFIGGCNLVIIVYKNKYTKSTELKVYELPDGNTDWKSWKKACDDWHEDIHLSCNSKMRFSFSEWEEIKAIIEEANEYLCHK